MIFHENCLLADSSHEMSCLIFSKIRKDVANFVVCCSRDWRFKGYNSKAENQQIINAFKYRLACNFSKKL